jgi:chemotaxis protein MotB
MSAASRRRRAPEEEHENHERWLVSYADMITVLMALFIVLFAISQIDNQKFLELRNGLAHGFGSSSQIPVNGGSGLLTDDGEVPNPTRLDVMAAPKPVNLTGNGQGGMAEGASSSRAGADQAATQAAAQREVARLVEVQKRLSSALEAQGLGDRVRFRITDRGLVAAVVADDVFFENASAAIQPTGRHVLEAMAPTLRDLPEEIAVEGHANHLKITGNALYPSNWELSAARAAAVVRHLAGPGDIKATRMSAIGFGDTRPLYPVTSAQAINGNRRVDLVVLSQQPAAVRALLPAYAARETGGS